MKKITLLNNVQNMLPDNLNIVVINDNLDCVCTDETAKEIEDWDDVSVEDMSDEEFEALPQFIKDQF